MTRKLWRIASDTPDYEADDLTGAGAKKTGGRWNRPGLSVLYASSNIALACLETVVHIKASSLPLNRYLVELTVPDDVMAGAETLSAATAPIGWDAEPCGKASLDFGDRWIGEKRSAILRVPSVIVPEEENLLLNPAHPDFAGISARKVRKWLYDPRLALR